MPNRHERRQRSREQTTSDVPDLGRRKFLGLLVGGAITVTGAGAALKFLVDQSSVDAQLEDNQRKETQTEPLVKLFEQGFDTFTNRATQLIDNANLSTQEREGLQVPFEIFKINRQNLERNIYLFKRRATEKSRSLSETQGFMQNPNFFFYDFAILETGNAASFDPLGRTLQISNRYNPNNILDNLIAMHELIHVAQDNSLKETVTQDMYRALYSPPIRKVLGLHEATAYAKEIFMLNLFTQGQFRQDVLDGKGHINTQKYITLLQARPEQSGTIEALGEMAYTLYIGRTSLTGIDRNFLAHINSIYRSKGYTPYMQTPNGFVVDQN